MGLVSSLVERFTATGRAERALIAKFTAREQRIRTTLVESLYTDLDNIVDPREENDGWQPLYGPAYWATQNTGTLREMRDKMRRIQCGSGTAIGAIEAVTDYVIGTGISYDYQVPRGTKDPERAELKAIREEANAVWADFVQRQNWATLEQQLSECADGDGEFFCRMFAGENGEVAVRFVDPNDVDDPSGNNRWGVISKPGDEQAIVGYIVKGETVPAAEMLHLPLNVPPNIPRGVPSLWPVKDNVIRGDTITRNVAKCAALQAALSMIRKHGFPLTEATGENLLNQLADSTKTNAFTGKPLRQQRFEGGTIMDVGAQTDIVLPQPANLAAFQPALLMNLRPIAVRLHLPDFAITGDVSATNFASVFTTMAPSSKGLARKQTRFLRVFQQLHEFVRAAAVAAGILPEAAMLLDSRVTGPEVANRDEVAQTNKRDVLFRNKILSPQTWGREEGYDPDEEQANIEASETVGGTTLPALETPPADAIDGATPAATSGSPEIDAAVAAADTSTSNAGTPRAKPGIVPAAIAGAPLPVGPQQIQTQTELVLNGAQISSALAIVQAVAKGELPRDSGVAMLQAFFNLAPDKAAAIMGSAGTSTPTTPNPKPAGSEPAPTGLPGAPPTPGVTPPQLKASADAVKAAAQSAAEPVAEE